MVPVVPWAIVVLSGVTVAVGTVAIQNRKMHLNFKLKEHGYQRDLFYARSHHYCIMHSYELRLNNKLLFVSDVFICLTDKQMKRHTDRTHNAPRSGITCFFVVVCLVPKMVKQVYFICMQTTCFFFILLLYNIKFTKGTKMQFSRCSWWYIYSIVLTFYFRSYSQSSCACSPVSIWCYTCTYIGTSKRWLNVVQGQNTILLCRACK